MHSWNQITEGYREAAGLRMALVSLVAKQGSSYLQPGARLLVREDGYCRGEISAGCLEEQVAGVAVDCIRSGEHRLLTIDTRPFYGCFGEITLLIEVIRDRGRFESVLDAVGSAGRQREPFVVVTDYGDLDADELTRIGCDEAGGKTRLREEIPPPFQLLVAGDWPDGCAAAEVARRLGWVTTLHDASAPTFSIGGTLDRHRLDSRTAILVATHNLARDAACLERALRTECGYIGVIGSRKRRQELARLIAEHDDFALIEGFERVCCPAGLDLGGQGAEVIALSIVAEIQARLSGRSGRQLSLRKAPIHAEEGPQ